jgi:hypothetical protein
MKEILIRRAKDLGSKVTSVAVDETCSQIKSTFFLTKMSLYVIIGFVGLMATLACVAIYKLIF